LAYLFPISLLLAPAAARAHGHLDHTEPRAGSQLASAPAEVKLWFSEALEAAFSTAVVTDANARRVDRADARVDAADKSVLRVPLQNLGPGAYTVHWRAVSVDTHVTQGDFVFRVN
jgi:methionine-rich copper-binding protein CopC